MEKGLPINLGIIAGAGPGPTKAMKTAQKSGHRVIFIAVAETKGPVPRAADVGRRISLTQVGAIFKTLEENNCDGVLLLGKFDKVLHNFDPSKLDETAMAMFMKLGGRGDMDIAKIVLEELEERGFPPVDQRRAFSDAVAPLGHIAGPEMAPERQEDVNLGVNVGRAIAGFDIGQTIVVHDGLVVAVEAAEHSDRCISRAGKLVDGSKCVVKVARPDQDFRFDTPAVGNKTLQTMAKAGANLLAVEAGRCIIMDRDFSQTAEQLNISVIGVQGPRG